MCKEEEKKKKAKKTQRKERLENGKQNLALRKAILYFKAQL